MCYHITRNCIVSILSLQKTAFYRLSFLLDKILFLFERFIYLFTSLIVTLLPAPNSFLTVASGNTLVPPNA